MHFLIELLAIASSLFVNEPKQIPLNTAVIAFDQTYYVPVVASPDILPKTYKGEITFEIEKKSETKNISENQQTTKPSPASPPVAVPTPVPPAPLTATIATAPTLAPPLPAAAAPQAPTGDPYLAIPEPITNWLNPNLDFQGSSTASDNPHTLPEVTFDREYWKIDAWAYWAPNATPPRPPIQNDYFKLEVYEKITDKLIYTAASGGENEESHIIKSFKKPGIYYFKVYTKDPSQWEISFWISSKLAQ